MILGEAAACNCVYSVYVRMAPSAWDRQLIMTGTGDLLPTFYVLAV